MATATAPVAGDKSGQRKRWYDENIPVAEQRHERWLDGGYGTEDGVMATSAPRRMLVSTVSGAKP